MVPLAQKKTMKILVYMKNIAIKRIVFSIALGLLALSVTITVYGRSFWHPLYLKLMGTHTLAEVITAIESNALSRLEPAFAHSGVSFPPQNVVFIAYKDSHQLQLWAGTDEQYHLVKTYPILAASGEPGPKLREGDRQVPEGVYRIEYFNPNSAYHLSMKLNYPNAFDLKYAQQEGRDQPGTNIFIHGKAVSIGCLAMGDTAIEELFTLSHRVGRDNIKVIISPSNPKYGKLARPPGAADWVDTLYQTIEEEIKAVSG